MYFHERFVPLLDPFRGALWAFVGDLVMRLKRGVPIRAGVLDKTRSSCTEKISEDLLQWVGLWLVEIGVGGV